MTIGGSAAALSGPRAATTALPMVLLCGADGFAAPSGSDCCGTAAASVASAVGSAPGACVSAASTTAARFCAAACCAVRKSRIMACSSRTSCTISAEAGIATAGARRARPPCHDRTGIGQAGKPPMTLASAAGSTSRTSLPPRPHQQRRCARPDRWLRKLRLQLPASAAYFSNGRLKFKHVLWAVLARNKEFLRQSYGILMWRSCRAVCVRQASRKTVISITT